MAEKTRINSGLLPVASRVSALAESTRVTKARLLSESYILLLLAEFFRCTLHCYCICWRCCFASDFSHFSLSLR